jgi:hypothetical protein
MAEAEAAQDKVGSVVGVQQNGRTATSIAAPSSVLPDGGTRNSLLPFSSRSATPKVPGFRAVLGSRKDLYLCEPPPPQPLAGVYS